MKFLIITYVNHKNVDKKYYAYEPYVKEMNIWINHVDEVEIVAPLDQGKKDAIDLAYKHDNLIFTKIPSIKFTSILSSLKSLLLLPRIIWVIYKACKRTDHIHLRSPGNIGLLGCFVQIIFPNKSKTAKYSGNWDFRSRQPVSYRLQKWILSNEFLTKNMKVLVYGIWPNQTKNILPFFTASFSKKEIENLRTIKDFNGNLKFVFVGSLVQGKRPLLAIQIIDKLNKSGIHSTLSIFGEGKLKNELQEYIAENDLNRFITLHGNVDKKELKSAYKQSHFVVLASKSEGWPKALAEGMFYGVIPIATEISCVNWMLDYGRRGIIIEPELVSATNKILSTLRNGNLESMSVASQQWSQKYTLEKFEQEITKLI